MLSELESVVAGVDDHRPVHYRGRRCAGCGCRGGRGGGALFVVVVVVVVVPRPQAPLRDRRRMRITGGDRLRVDGLQVLDELADVVVNGPEGPEPVLVDLLDGCGGRVGDDPQLPEEPVLGRLGGIRGVVARGLGRRRLGIVAGVPGLRREWPVGGRPGDDREPRLGKVRELPEGVLLQDQREVVLRVGVPVLVEADGGSGVAAAAAVAGPGRSLDDRVVVVPRVSLEAVPVIPSPGDRRGPVLVVVEFVPVQVLARVQGRVSGRPGVNRQRVVVLLVAPPPLGIAVPRDAVVPGQAPVVDVFSRQEGRPAGTANRNVDEAALPEGHALFPELFVEYRHIGRRIEGTEGDVLVVGQKQQDVLLLFCRLALVFGGVLA